MTGRECEEEGAGGELADAGVRCEAVGCFWAIWGFGWDVGVAILSVWDLEVLTRRGRLEEGARGIQHCCCGGASKFARRNNGGFSSQPDKFAR